jgi:uncharacterized protein
MRRRALLCTMLCYGALAATGGCSVLDPQPDRTHFFVLSPMAEAPLAGGLENTVVALGPVKFPDYLGRLEIVTRTDENRLRFSDTERWAEPLELNFTRVLSQDLAVLMNLGEVVSYPWFADTGVDYQVPVYVLRFESDDSGDVVLDARWTVKAANTGKVLYAKDSRIVEKGASPSQTSRVAAMNGAVTKLAREIATELGRVARR